MKKIGLVQTVCGMIGLVAMSGLLIGCVRIDPGINMTLRRAQLATKAAHEGRIEEAREYFDKAHPGTTDSYVLNLAHDFYISTGNLAIAEEILERMLANGGREDTITDTAAIQGKLGLIYQKRGELDRAEEMLKKALAIEEKLGRQEGMAARYDNLGRIAHEREDYAQARELWTKARDLYAKIGMPKMVKQVQGLLDSLPSE